MRLTISLALIVNVFGPAFIQPPLATTQDGLAITQPAATQSDERPAVSTDPAAEIDPGWQATVQEQLRQSEYQLSWQESSQVSGLGAAFQAPKRAHNLRTYFTPEGITVTPRACGEAACAAPRWQWGLQLTGYGWDNSQKPLPVSDQPRAEGNCAAYHYPTATILNVKLAAGKGMLR